VRSQFEKPRKLIVIHVDDDVLQHEQPPSHFGAEQGCKIFPAKLFGAHSARSFRRLGDLAEPFCLTASCAEPLKFLTVCVVVGFFVSSRLLRSRVIASDAMRRLSSVTPDIPNKYVAASRTGADP